MGATSERHGSVAVLRIDRPDRRNAIDPPTARKMDSLWGEFERDDSVAAVVLTASGREAFCAGVDLRTHAEEGPEGVLIGEHGFTGITQRRFPKPLIAAVNGAALGGGFELALACDLILAVPHATFAFPEVKLGLLADSGGLIRLPRRIPHHVATELLFTGDPIGAERAAAFGLVNRVVPPSQLLKAAVELGERIAANASDSVRLSKQLLQETCNLPEPEAWTINNSYMTRIAETDDYHEGPRAFVEKRTPSWVRARDLGG